MSFGFRANTVQCHVLYQTLSEQNLTKTCRKPNENENGDLRNADLGVWELKCSNGLRLVAYVGYELAVGVVKRSKLPQNEPKTEKQTLRKI